MNIWMIGKDLMKYHYHVCSYLYMEDVTDADDAYAKRLCKDFGIKTFRITLSFFCSE